MVRLFPLIGALSVCFLTPAVAQEVGNPEAGFALAVDVCAECHDVMPMDGVTPVPGTLPFDELEAKPFAEIANTSGVTAMALFAWLQSSHPTMPDIILANDEMTDVVAYILSLKDR